MVKLSVCIATFNRADFIGETLNSIIPQLTEETELLVVDGASTDNTEQVMHDFLQRSDRIRYIQLPVKGGVDHDYNCAVELAVGEYCWLFTDDDVAKPGTVQAILEQIQQGFELVVVNAEVRNFDFSKLIEEKRLPIVDNKVYKIGSFEQFFVENTSYMSFIGCVVIKRNIWLDREKDHYYGSEFIHLGVICQKPFHTPISVIANPYIVIRLGNAQWTDRAFEIWVFKWPKLLWSFDCISQTAKLMLCPKEPWSHIPRLTLLRAKGNFSSQEYFKFIKPRVASIVDRAIIRAITFVPGCLLNILAIAYYSLKSSNNQSDIYALKSSKYYLFY